jgi:peptide/nickel transport system permease protein
VARWLGRSLAAGAVGIALMGPWIAPHRSSDQFDDFAYAPPSRVHVIADGRLTSPYIHPMVLENRLSRTYREDASVRIPLQWFSNGRMVSSGDPRQPLLLLGADAIGRDVFSRFVLGARLSLGVALVGVAGALLLGTFVGSLAGATGGLVDRGLMVAADFLIAVPGAYLVLVLRGVLRPVLATGETFAIMAALFTVAAWPHAARGVRAIVASERTRDYAEAARAGGAGPLRLARHLVPAARGFLATEVLLLIPALLVAEATISYLGLGFADAAASWGTMLQDAANAPVLLEAPWMLAPAVGMFLTVLGVHLIGAGRARRTSLGY